MTHDADAESDADFEREPEDDAAAWSKTTLFYTWMRINFNYWCFPGLILHELAHYLAALLAGVKVYEVKLWGPDGAHVIHARARTLASMLMSVAPAIVGWFAAIFFLQLAREEVFGIDTIVYYWLAFSFAVYAFPSRHDLKNAAWSLKRYGERPRKGIDAILAGIVYVPLWLLQAFFELHSALFAQNTIARFTYFAVLVYLVNAPTPLV